MPLDWCRITNHWLLHLPDKLEDHGCYHAVNILAEERMHQTIRRLVTNSKKHVMSSLAINYSMFEQLHTDWSLESNIAGRSSHFRRSGMAFSDQNIIPGKYEHKKKRAESLPDDLYRQLQEKWQSSMGDDDDGGFSSENRVYFFKSLMLDGQKVAPARYNTTRKDCSCFVSEYIDDDSGDEFKAYGKVRSLFRHSITHDVRGVLTQFFVDADWYSEVGRDQITGLVQIKRNFEWDAHRLESVYNFFPDSVVFWPSEPFRTWTDENVTGRLRREREETWSVVEQRNAIYLDNN